MNTRNAGVEALLASGLDGPVPDFLKPLLESAGLPEDMSLGGLVEHMRALSHKVDAEAVRSFYRDTAGWDIVPHKTEQPGTEIGHGDLIGFLDVDGAKVPAYAHMAITDLLDRTDPALEKLLFSTSGAPAVVFHVLPRFWVDADRDGAVRTILLAGGWYNHQDMWLPFVIAPGGPEALAAKAKFIKAGEPSRGLLRSAGLEPRSIQAIRDFAAAMERVALIEGMMASGPQVAEEMRLGTDSRGWSSFYSDDTMLMQQQLMQSLAVPTPEKREITEDMDIYEIAPDALIDCLEGLGLPEDAVTTMLESLASLTNGFEGLDDQTCASVTPMDIDTLVRCATAQVSAIDLANVLEDAFGWTITAVNLAEDEEDAIYRHGDVPLVFESKSMGEAIPLLFHGGAIDPTCPQEDFAFAASRLMALSRFEGLPCLIMPTSVSMRPPAGAPSLEKDPMPEKLAVIAGYAYDGANWFPVTFGRHGSDPFDNKLMEATLLPKSASAYCVEEDELPPPIGRAFMLKMMIDRHHNLGPEVSLPRNIDPQSTYAMLEWDKNWVALLDVVAEEAYPRRE